jgi:hypothetical protein
MLLPIGVGSEFFPRKTGGLTRKPVKKDGTIAMNH